MKSKLLIVEDEKNMIWALGNALKSEHYQLEFISRGDDALALVKKEMPALVLLDIKLPGMNGIDVLKEIREIDATVPVIMMTAHGTLETAIQALKLGATDYLSKPFDLEELRIIVSKSLTYGKITSELHFLKDEINKNLKDTIIGESAVMKDVLTIAQQVAQSDATVLISGESGTGKEVIADFIYKASSRSQKAFIKVNCGALTETLLESELFGHEKGSFTGAVARKLGRFERADGGTIFLDEIGEMPHSLQVKLLRVIQQQEFERVGGVETLQVDVRILAATNRDLVEMIKNGTFREDLYYRLNVIPIKIPGLRNRKEDIPLLVDYFSEKISLKMKKNKIVFDDEAMSFLMKYQWKGNIRELENMIERIVILNNSDKVSALNLPAEILSNNTDSISFILPEEGIDLEVIEKSFIEQALLKSNNNQTKAAKLLGITRHTLLYRLEKYKIKYE